MTTQADKSLLVPEKWWELPEYQEPELYLPGQSRLDEEGNRLLELTASKAACGNLHLPPMPEAAREAVRLLSSDDAEIEEIATALNKDPALTAHVLAHANSALYGAASIIDTTGHALSFLGLRRTQGIIMQAALKHAAQEIGNRLYAAMEWRHSIFCANIARRLGKLAGVDPEQCYTAALLHDIGRIPILHTLNANDALPPQPSDDDRHEIILEVIHRGVGVQMAEAWKLPPAVKDAIKSHVNGRLPDEESLAQYPSTRVVEAASDLCIALGLGCIKRPFAVLKAPSFQGLGASEDELIGFCDRELPVIISDVSEIA